MKISEDAKALMGMLVAMAILLFVLMPIALVIWHRVCVIFGIPWSFG
jgi:hypothetical protein